MTRELESALATLAEEAASQPPAGETTADLLAALEKQTQVPVLIADGSGELIAASPNLRGECAVAAAQGEAIILSRGPRGELTCPQTRCRHHPRYAASPLSQAAGNLQVVHCRGPKEAEAAAELVSVALGSDREKVDLMDALAHAYEEIHLLETLAGASAEESDYRVTFLNILNTLRELVPFNRSEIWVLDHAAREFRCLFHHDGATIKKSMESIPSDPGVEAEIEAKGLRILRAGQLGEDILSRLLQQFVSGVGMPAVVLPLRAKARLLGILTLQVPEKRQKFDSTRLRMLAAAGRQASLVLQVHVLIAELRSNEGLRREIEIARQIQQSLLPQEIPEGERFDVFAGCVAAAHVGGDYYDFFETSPGELGMLIADVSGHSVASGLVAMSFRSSFKHFLAERLEMAELFHRVNRTLQPEMSRTGHFLSAFCCKFNQQSCSLRYVNAGHNPPLVYSTATGGFKSLTEAGLLIGVLPQWDYSTAEAILQEGDILVLYTDGIVEAENGHEEMFGMERLKEAIRKYANRSAKEMYHYLLKELYLFQDEQFNKDDVTLIILKVK